MRLHHIVCTGLILFPTIVVANRGEAQAGGVPRSRFGIVFGVNSATWGGSDATNPTPTRHTGVMIGATFIKPLSEPLSLQPELLYSMKGAESKDASGSGAVKINYVEIPLLLRYDVAVSRGLKPFFYAGPALSPRVSCNLEFDGPSFTDTTTCEQTETQSGGATKFAKVDYGLIVGGGFGFDLSGSPFTVGLRYDHGLTKIEKSSELFNRVISVVGTLEFPHRK